MRLRLLVKSLLMEIILVAKVTMNKVITKSLVLEAGGEGGADL